MILLWWQGKSKLTTLLAFPCVTSKQVRFIFRPNFFFFNLGSHQLVALIYLNLTKCLRLGVRSTSQGFKLSSNTIPCSQRNVLYIFWYILKCTIRFFFFFFLLNLLSWTVMNVSLDTLHNSEWSEFPYFCRPLLYIPYQYAFAKLCLFLSKPCQNCFQVVCTIQVMLSQSGLFTVYIFFFLFLVLYFKMFLRLNVFWFWKNKISVNFSNFVLVFIIDGTIDVKDMEKSHCTQEWGNYVKSCKSNYLLATSKVENGSIYLRILIVIISPPNFWRDFFFFLLLSWPTDNHWQTFHFICILNETFGIHNWLYSSFIHFKLYSSSTMHWPYSSQWFKDCREQYSNFEF